MASSLSGAKSMIPEEPLPANSDPMVRAMHIMAVLGMLLGCAGLVSLPFGLARLHQGSLAGDLSVNLFAPSMESPSAQVVWLYASSAMGTGLALMLVLASIAAIHFRPIARPILLLWATASLMVGGGGSYFYFRWLVGPERESYAQVRGVVDTLANFGGWGIGTTLAIVMLYLLTRPTVKRAFQGQAKPRA
jgi:hypothetical protein